ncbi:MAG: peptidyl-prolyl cis-trans isomerase [Bryobacteraceae bacterium]|nr:peptidyl-prolyl cis-trans isomerase [Bryobacteraceae bacterium]
MQKYLPALLGAALSALAADVQLIDEIIAKVNGDIITRGEIARSRKQFENELKQQRLSPAEMQRAMEGREKDLLKDRIDQLLLVQKAKEANVNVESELSKYFADLQRQSKIPEPENFQQYVREQSGMAFEDFKNEVRNSMMTQQVIRREVSGKINIPKDELRKYYEEHKAEFIRKDRVFLREILVSTEGKDEAGIALAEKKAKDLAARARKGEKFADLAQNGSDAMTAQQGGWLGAFEKMQLLEAISNDVWDKPRGYVSEPIKVANGFLVLRVEEHQKEGQAEFEEVENEIMDKVFSPKMQPAIREFLVKLRQDAFLEIKPGWVDTGAAPGKNTTWTDPAQLKPETVTKAEVENRKRAKKLLWAIPIPGTEAKPKSSSSR